MSKQLDIVICIVPKVEPVAPTVGPALLKAILMQEGFSCSVIDFNISLFNEMQKKNDMDRFFTKDLFFRTNLLTEDTTDFDKFYTEYEYLFLEWIENLRTKNPKFVGLSLLTFYSVAAGTKISQLIREHLPDVKIVWGGPAVETDTKMYKDAGIIDYYIAGDGEKALVQLLNNNPNAPNINLTPKVQVLSLKDNPIPNYDDINWQEYTYDPFKAIYVTGSRGCVKNCNFCNINDVWPKFVFRSGADVVKEILYLQEKYDRYEIRFTDSLINGSLPAYRELLQELNKLPTPIRWKSQWIVRSKAQAPEEEFKLLKSTGCSILSIGIESFSEKVRFHMNKKFTNEDMWWCFEMLHKYGIRHSIMFITGYPTETEEDHQNTLATLRKMHSLGYLEERNGIEFVYLSFGSLLQLSKNTELWEKVGSEITNYQNDLIWDYHDNTFPVRVRWLREIYECIISLTGPTEFSEVHFYKRIVEWENILKDYLASSTKTKQLEAGYGVPGVDATL
jgi:radical SAM superfamily enzyme YgiQ (UPF0313 family)